MLGADLVADRGQHDRRDRPGHHAEAGDGEVERRVWQRQRDQQVGRRLQPEDDDEAGLAAEPVRERPEDRAGEEAQEADDRPEAPAIVSEKPRSFTSEVTKKVT